MTRSCLVCGGQVPPSRGNRRLTCSGTCRAAHKRATARALYAKAASARPARPRRPCEECGSPVRSPHPRYVTCSPLCSSRRSVRIATSKPHVPLVLPPMPALPPGSLAAAIPMRSTAYSVAPVSLVHAVMLTPFKVRVVNHGARWLVRERGDVLCKPPSFRARVGKLEAVRADVDCTLCLRRVETHRIAVGVPRGTRPRPAPLEPRHPSWRDQAACLGMDVATFYASERYHGGALLPNPAAVAACKRCPVTLQCLHEVIRQEGGTTYGYRAGMTADERKTYVRDVTTVATMTSPWS